LCISTTTHDNLTMTFHREHRPLEAYIRALIRAGFSIEELCEVTDKDPSKPSHRVPMFLDILAVRQSRKETPDGTCEQSTTSPLLMILPPVISRFTRKRGTPSQCRGSNHSMLRRVARARLCSIGRGVSPLPFILCGVFFSGLLVTAIAWVA
jgi:hypothetical protein